MALLKLTDKNGQEWEFDESEAVYRKSVYGCAIHNNRILLILDPRSDKWELPGGGVDTGETDEQALRREIKEETGLEADTSNMQLIEQVHGYYKSLEHDFPWKTDRNYFSIQIKNPDGPILSAGNNDDTSECKWVDLDELDNLSLAEVDKAVITKYLKVWQSDK